MEKLLVCSIKSCLILGSIRTTRKEKENNMVYLKNSVKQFRFFSSPSACNLLVSSVSLEYFHSLDLFVKQLLENGLMNSVMD